MDRREVLGVFGATAADVTGVAAGAEETAEDRKDIGEADKTAKARPVWKEENLTGRAYEYFHKLQSHPPKGKDDVERAGGAYEYFHKLQ